MKNLVKIAFLSSVITAAMVYVVLEWKPLRSDLSRAPDLSWASSVVSSTAAGMITAALWVRRVRRMVFAAWIAVELILRPTEPEENTMAADDKVVLGLVHAEDDPESVLICYLLGVEALRAGKQALMWLTKDGIKARVVSMPSWEIFDEQSAEYKQSVLPDAVAKIAVEAGSPLGWWKYVGKDGAVIGLDRYGASAPGNVVLEKLGFTGPSVAERAKKLVKGRQ